MDAAGFACGEAIISEVNCFNGAIVKKYKIAACILHYGDPALTGRLYGQLKAEPDVYVLDNAAPEPFPGAWKRLEENLFWAGALAWALREFEGMGYTHLWFFNNDAYFLSRPPYLKTSAVRLARMELALGRVGIYAPAVSASPYHPQMVQNENSQYRSVAVLDGIAPLVNFKCIGEIGGLDAADNPYGYGVDLWMSVRAREAGWSLVVDNQVLLRHSYHATARKVDGFMDKAAEAERRFLQARLGVDYKNFIREQQKQCREITIL